jgi:DNA-binding transcriptional MerR regulator
MTSHTEVPDKKYFTIGEVSKLCDIKQHVLRYWEQEFSQLSPSKRRGNRRYYQKKDIEMVKKIRILLYDERFTIYGAKQKLTGMPSLEEQSSTNHPDEVCKQKSTPNLETEQIVRKLLTELKELDTILSS